MLGVLVGPVHGFAIASSGYTSKASTRSDHLMLSVFWRDDVYYKNDMHLFLYIPTYGHTFFLLTIDNV